MFEQKLIRLNRIASASEKDETINYFVRECSKWAQKNKTRHEWVVKVIHWKLCKKTKFYYNPKWHVDKPETARDNETHLILWDFKIKMEPYIRPEDQI